MKRSPLSIFIIVLAALLLASCEVDFSPNAEWKEIPVVYCLLDQDDDTTWARVERCYLGDGDIRRYSSVSDSVNYPEGQIEVWLVAYSDGAAVDSMQFDRTTIDRNPGNFVSEGQPTYFCCTRGWLRENRTYSIRVRRTADGSVLAENNEPISLIVKSTTDSLFTKPQFNYWQGGRTFAFKDGQNSCEIAWNALQGARLYQPVVRMYYAVGGDTLHADIKSMQKQASNNATSYTVSYSESSYLEGVRQHLQGDTSSKFYVSVVDLYLTACSEDLNAYLFSVSGSSSAVQESVAYTNIKGGLGIFAARRLKLYSHMRADDSTVPGSGLLWKLKQLNVGF